MSDQGMKKKTRRVRMDRIAQDKLLDAVPVVNEAVRTEMRGKALVILVPIRKRWWMGPPLGWVLPFRNEKGIALDGLGQEVWKACNGKRTTEQIIEGFAAKHKLRFHEARLSVMQFLQMLVQRNLLAMAMTDDPKEMKA